MQAILRFRSYAVDYMYYKRNHLFWDSIVSGDDNIQEPIDVSPDFMFEIVKNPDNYKQANIIVGVKIGNDDEDGSAPFKVEAVIRGYFEIIDDSTTEERALRFYSENSIAILYPYLRSIVSDLTGKSDHQPIILPTLNIINIAKEYLKRQNDENEETKLIYQSPID